MTTAKVVALTVRGPERTVSLSMSEIKAMAPTAGYGGWKNVLDNITPPRPYRGVSLRALMGLVGDGSTVTLVASDSYEQDFTPDEIAGAVATYDPSTGRATDGYSGVITPAVAYELNGAPISEKEGGPLRIVFLSPSPDQVTDSKLWVKFVSTVNVR